MLETELKKNTAAIERSNELATILIDMVAARTGITEAVEPEKNEQLAAYKEAKTLPATGNGGLPGETVQIYDKNPAPMTIKELDTRLGDLAKLRPGKEGFLAIQRVMSETFNVKSIREIKPDQYRALISYVEVALQ